jgi:hypothetical protein
MKKIGLIFILLLAVLMKAAVGYSDSANDEIVDLATIVMENDLAIDKWQVTMKEQTNRNKAHDLVDKLKNSYLVSTANDENIIKYSFSDVHKADDIVESYMVIIPKNTMYEAEVIAVIHGDVWDDSTEQKYDSAINSLPDYLFTKKAQRFSCLTAMNNGIMNSDVFLKILNEKLDVEHISTQTDSVKKSAVEKNMYGYTPLWDQKIKIMDKEVNVQVAMRESKNGDTKFTIGTPILITEY